MILDWIFPWCMDNIFGKGFRPEVARAAKQCHLHLDHSRKDPHMCLANECMSWKWLRPKVSPWMFLTKRRGKCDHPLARKS